MSFLGLEKPVEYGHFLAFDPRMALMVLNAYGDYINAARQDYLLGQEEVKDFLSKYGDFTSPIEKDVENWNNITINPLNKLLDEAYANGIDPLRNREFRNRLLAQARSVNGADLAKLKLSAEIAREFVKERSKLEALGLYNPIYAKYDGPDITTYDTLKDGIWQKTSPTPIQNMAVFTKDYFDNLKPFTRSASKNGVSYTKSEITEQDLYNIAASRFNDLVNTPQGRLMYQMYLDLTGDPYAAKDMFNASVVSGNMDRLFYKDDYDEQQYKAATLSLQREKLNFDKQKHRMEHPELYGGGANIPQAGEEGFSWIGRTYETALANAGSNGSTVYSFKDIPQSYETLNKTLGLTQIDFGKLFVGKHNISEEQFNKKWKDLKNGLYHGTENSYTYAEKLRKLNESKGSYDDVKRAFLNRFTTKADVGTFVAWHGGLTHSKNKSVIMASEFDINKLIDEDSVVTGTMGYTKKHRGDTSALRNKYLTDGSGNKKSLADVTITPLGDVYGAILKDGAFHIYMKVRVTEGKNSDVCYYDMGARSAKRNKGAYLKDIKSSDLYYMDGSLITPRKAFSGMSQGFVPIGIPNVDFTFKRNPNASSEEFNLYPDYSIWSEYGPADVRANAYLKAKATQYNAGY